MVNRISTYSVYKNTMDDIATVNNRLVAQQRQISSGTIAYSYVDIGNHGQITNMISSEYQLAKTDDYITNNNNVLDRMNAMDKSLDQLIGVVQTMLQDLTARRGISGTHMNLAQTAQTQYLPTIQNSLNTNFEGRYLFAGSRTDTPPVGEIVNNSNILNGVITASYYNGDDVRLSASASDSMNVTYGLTADMSQFQNLIACAHTIITSDLANKDDQIAKAMDMANTSLQELIALRSSLGSNTKAIQNLNKTYEGSKIYLQETINTQIGTDLPAVMTQFYADKTALMASYQAFSKLSSLSLINYLS